MPTITISQALIKEKELILIPRREYDKLLKKQTTKRETKVVKRSASFRVPQKNVKFYEKLDKELTKSVMDYEREKFVGPFSSVKEMRRFLEK